MTLSKRGRDRRPTPGFADNGEGTVAMLRGEPQKRNTQADAVLALAGVVAAANGFHMLGAHALPIVFHG